MQDASKSSGAGGFGELEDSFFDRAPPEVAVAPPPAANFDDLNPALPARLTRRTKAKASRRPARKPDEARARAAAMTGRASQLLAAARVAVARAVAGAISKGRPLTASLAGQARAWLSSTGIKARESSILALRGARARLLAELPSERPDGRTLVAAVAALVIVLSVSASVLGARGEFRLSPLRPALTAPVAQTAP